MLFDRLALVFLALRGLKVFKLTTDAFWFTMPVELVTPESWG